MQGMALELRPDNGFCIAAWQGKIGLIDHDKACHQHGKYDAHVPTIER